jgi:hypothetical protein
VLRILISTRDGRAYLAGTFVLLAMGALSIDTEIEILRGKVDAYAAATLVFAGMAVVCALLTWISADRTLGQHHRRVEQLLQRIADAVDPEPASPADAAPRPVEAAPPREHDEQLSR